MATILLTVFILLSQSQKSTIASLKSTAAAPRLPAHAVSASPAVLQACIRGRNYFDKREAKASEQAFRQAIDFDPGYAPAHTGLANALASEVLMGDAPGEVNVPRALAAAQRALQLEPQSGDAWIARGSIELMFLWQWEAAKADLQRGILLSPGNSFGYMQMSILDDLQGDVDEAVAHMRRAVRNRPPLLFHGPALRLNSLLRTRLQRSTRTAAIRSVHAPAVASGRRRLDPRYLLVTGKA